MDFLDRMQASEYLGAEFIVFLWWMSEIHDDGFELPELGPIRFWLEGSLTLETKRVELEQSSLRGAAPSTSPEARMALAQAKRPVRAQLRVSSGSLEWSFVFRADTFALSAVKVPEELKDGGEEAFLERMGLVESLEAMLAALYREFLTLRLGAAWEATVGESIRAWVQTGEAPSPEAYVQLRRHANAA